jgi:hypothetical protein
VTRPGKFLQRAIQVPWRRDRSLVWAEWESERFAKLDSGTTSHWNNFAVRKCGLRPAKPHFIAQLSSQRDCARLQLIQPFQTPRFLKVGSPITGTARNRPAAPGCCGVAGKYKSWFTRHASNPGIGKFANPGHAERHIRAASHPY